MQELRENFHKETGAVDNESRQAALTHFETEILPSYIVALSEKTITLAQGTLKEFADAIEFLGNAALDELLLFLDIPETIDLDPELAALLLQTIVAEFNGTLPLAHPYIAVIVETQETGDVQFGAMRRKQIPGAHEMTTAKIIVIVRVPDTEHLDQLRLSSFEYHSPYDKDLPDFDDETDEEEKN